MTKREEKTRVNRNVKKRTFLIPVRCGIKETRQT